ncbi:hypothetical protein PROSTU_00184 [Providencia stuartii ATCC 25827]|uniref:Uncharacterized protein n=1 Tax=Providencia stuartii ATCC 25827 TaxID=471874 RepID=A0AA86YPL4_PROST|nr:hypothetical protein PROSTU_00184 [Providencia stuartii ATCC 25827]
MGNVMKLTSKNKKIIQSSERQAFFYLENEYQPVLAHYKIKRIIFFNLLKRNCLQY